MSPPQPDPPQASLLEALFRASPDAVVVVEADGTIRAASPAVRALFGVDPEELVGRSVETLVPERFRRVHAGHRRDFNANPHSRPMGAGLQLEGQRADGTVVPIDVSLTPVVVEGEPLVAAYVRDATDRRRGEALLEYVNEIDQHLLGGAEVEETLTVAANRARRLVQGAAAWIVVPAGDRLVVAAVDGAGTESLLGAEMSAEASLSGQTMGGRTPQHVADMSSDRAVLARARQLGLGAGMYLPLTADGQAIGALVLARAAGDPAFSPADTALADVFASSAGLALSLGEARRELDELRFTAEHDRIARDLHDTVIQRLFALGMALQGVLRMASGPVAERINIVVDSLDEVIREIRETIFDLQHGVRPGSLRREVRLVVNEAEEQLGFRPQLAFRGPVDTAVPDAVVPHLLAVTREGLSNVARHARASIVSVLVEVGRDAVLLRIADNGIGPPAGPTSGNGLVNMAGRAKELGGDLQLAAGPLGGTVLEWRVKAQ